MQAPVPRPREPGSEWMRSDNKHMKRMTIVITLLLILAPEQGEEARCETNIRDALEEQRRISKEQVDIARQKVEAIRLEIKQRNLKFRVEVTEAIKHRISQITGIKVPRGIEKDARVQNSLGEQMFLQFLKRLDEMERRSRIEPEETVPEEETPPEGTYEETPTSEKEERAPLSDKELNRLYILADPYARAFSWLERGAVTPVKQQGVCGSCWAFSSAAACESGYLIVNGGALDLSEQYLIDCAVDRAGMDAGGCDGGWSGQAFDFLSGRGIALERDCPYTGGTDRCRALPRADCRIAAWGYVMPDAGIPPVEEVKRALCTYGPLAACVKVTPAFQAYAGGIFDEHAAVWGPKDVNHAVLLIGWDDDKKSYLLKNSWGEAWGEKGMMWIEYGCNNIGYGAAWIAVEKRERHGIELK